MPVAMRECTQLYGKKGGRGAESPKGGGDLRNGLCTLGLRVCTCSSLRATADAKRLSPLMSVQTSR